MLPTLKEAGADFLTQMSFPRQYLGRANGCFKETPSLPKGIFTETVA